MADKLPSGPKVSGMDIVDAFLSKMKTETKQDGGTIEYNIKVEGTNELQKANELIEKFHKLNKQSKGNYFTSEAKGLENVTDAFERYTKAQSEYDKKIARGDLVRWTNAYKARDDFDQSKISQQILDTASEAEKALNGSTGRGYIHYSVDSFRELFSVMKEMQDTGYYDMGQFSKNFNAIPKAAKDAANQARKQMEQTPIITEDMIINSDQIKARISELETSISDFYNRYQKEAELIKKGEARQYIKNLQELEDLYSLTNSNKYIDDKFFDLQDNQLLADYPGINMERIKKEVNTSINQFKKSIKNSLSDETHNPSTQVADGITQTGEAASTATTQVNEFNEAVNRGNESAGQSSVAESFAETGQAADDATKKMEKFNQTVQDGQKKTFMTEQEQARISEEYKASDGRIGTKAGDIDQLREQYKYLTLINESIKNWNEKKTGIYGPMKDSLENLEKYKAEILENNPQLQSVSDHIKGNRLLGGDFKREFATFFPSFEALEETYDHIFALQSRMKDVNESAKPTYVKKLNEQRKAFVDMYEAYNEMTNGKMDVDVPGKKNITDMRNMYIALKDGLKATQETVHESGAVAGTPQFVDTADAVGQAAESATEKVRELNSEMQNTSSSTTSGAVAGVSKEFEELETAINNTQNKYAQAIFNKSFTTKNKTAAQAQLKENYLAMQDILEADDWNNLSQRGEVAAYNYLKSFQEAVQKGVRPQMLEKYTIDAFKTFDGKSYLYDSYAKNTSEEFDIQLEDRISKIKAFTSIMDEMKTKYPDADLSKRSEVSGKNMLNEMLEYANIFNRIRSNKTDDTGLFDFKYFENELKSQKEYIDSMLKTDQIFRERDKFNKYMPKGEDFNNPQTYIQVSEKYDSLATEISNGSKTAEQAIAELNAEIEKLNSTTSQAETGQSRADALNAEAEAARNDADAQRELATAKKEANSQVSSRQSTAMSDTTKELRKVWYYGTNETFDEFDVSKNEQATYGAGGYLTDDKKMAQTYGKNVMEFFADISNAYVEGSELSKEQIQKVWDEYGQYLGELQNNNKFKNLSQISKFDVSTIEGFGNFLNNPKTSTQFILNSLAKAKDKSLTSTDIFKSLGYDSYYYPKNDILNIFDSKNIIKATDEVKNSLQQYGDVRREVTQASASAPGESEQMEQFEQEAKAAKQATDAEKELANARKETAGQTPVSQGAASAEAQAQANRDEAASAREAATAEQERAAAAQQANDVAGQSTSSDTSAESVEASAQSHERAAAAAQEHAEAARRANEAEGQKPTQADTSNSEAQTQANEQEARSAQQAAEAEKERANAAQQANQTAGQAPATATSSENINAEAGAMESLQTAVTGVTEAVNAKTEAFSAEQSAVSSAIQAEIASLESLKQALSDIKQSVSDMGEAFNSIGKDNPFTSMFDNINKNAEALKNFADILKATREQQEQATKAAAASNDRIINEKSVDPNAWKEYLKNNKTLVDELGGIVDVREQTRVGEKSGEEYISYLLKGKTGSAIIGKNGHLLNKNILQSDDFSQHQQNVKDQYKDAIQAIKDYGKAVEELNQLKIDAIQDKPVDGDRITATLDRANEAAQRCIESLKTLDSLNKSGEISKRQYDEANRIASETQKRINDSNTKVKTASNNQEYQDQINIIQKAIEARNEYNKMLTSETKGYTTPTDQRDAIVSNLEATADAYKNAIEHLKELQEEEKITAEQFNAADQMFGQGTKGSQSALDKAYQDKIAKQVEKIQRYQTAANKAETTQNKFNVGDATAKQVQNAVDRMNELKTAAEEAMSVLEQMNKTEGSSKFIPDDTLNKYKQIMEQVKQMNGLFTTGDRTNAEFATIERGYQTLMRYADQYTRIMEKKRSEEALSFNDLQFLSKYGSYYQDAAKNAGLFEDAQNKAADSMKKFQETMNNSDAAAFNETLQKMGQTLAELGKGTWNKLGQEALKDLNTQYENLVKSTIDYKNSSKEVQAQMRSDVQSVAGGLGQFIDYKDQGYYTTAREKLVAALDAKMATWQFNNSAATGAVQQIDKLRASLEGISPGRLEEVNAEFEKIKASAASAGTLGKSFGDSLKKSFMGLGRYLATYTSFYRVIGTIKSAVNMVKELDTALMEVRKVAAKPLSDLKEWQKGTFEQADEVGTTGKQLQQSTAAWLRLGKSFSESQEAAKASSWLLNVSEFKNIDDATTALVSMKQAYNDLSFEDIIDKLNNVGDHFSSATDQLASGLQNAGAVLKTQGNDIDKSLALLTAGKSLPDSMETYFKYIFNCVECLKTYSTIVKKLHYQSLIIYVYYG